MTAPLIDIGINLAHEAFNPDRDAVLAAARAAGVKHLIVTGSSVASSQAARALARRTPGELSSTAGLHPHHAADWSDAAAGALRQLAAEPGVVAIGECGLDFYRDFAPRPAQEQAFRAQVELAIELGRPLFLHCRDAHARFIAVLREYAAVLPPAVAHCFTGTEREAQECLALGLHLGITAWICDERRGLHLRHVVRGIPLTRLMLETDAPYLLPRDLRPAPAHRRNEPRFLPHICAAVAAARGEDAATLAAATTATARAFFRLPAAGAGDAGN